MATACEGLVVGLTAELADKQARLEAATQAGINTAPLKRQIAQIESDLTVAKKRVIEAFHAVPSNPYV
ncbi:hypothetical protein B0G80_4388 [Paraburkholderia sp. BL6669N2]|uniref:hypothetical protein n=1 Tax=Paraburkholderia sp. BL6669N2 TaxID=1938807 RepID=UPI000E389B1E|nr:hypothetical protein [Paraburkholderia sp. BL6669N2]REG61535.1 hypothetical protein B0G80_4388 [Paraburkholderia sp. BL6669N2]